LKKTASSGSDHKPSTGHLSHNEEINRLKQECYWLMTWHRHYNINIVFFILLRNLNPSQNIQYMTAEIRCMNNWIWTKSRHLYVNGAHKPPALLVSFDNQVRGLLDLIQHSV
jgi:hypothetical protein